LFCSSRVSLVDGLELGSTLHVQWIDQSIGDDGSSGASYGTPPRREFGLFCGHDVSWGRVARGSAERSLKGEGDGVRIAGFAMTLCTTWLFGRRIRDSRFSAMF
jgi:hypothetical protein